MTLLSSEPIVTAEKYIEYKKASGHIAPDFAAPKSILVCYQSSTLSYFLRESGRIEPCADYSDLFLVEDGRAGILAGWGIGAPALAIKLEELAALGADRFIAVGTAGTLVEHPIGSFIVSPKALAEDGVAHLYLPEGGRFAEADEGLLEEWAAFAKEPFYTTDAWSFSAIYRESPADIARVKALGCGVVEMEAATLFAIGRVKNVRALSLFVVSDRVGPEAWTPRHKDPLVRVNLHALAESALAFCLIQDRPLSSRDR